MFLSDINLVIRKSKKYETVLTKNYGAVGKGLHEKISSIENLIEVDLIKSLRLVATVRNKLLHDDDYKKIDNREGFLKACLHIEKSLGIKKDITFILIVAMLQTLVILCAFYLSLIIIPFALMIDFFKTITKDRDEDNNRYKNNFESTSHAKKALAMIVNQVKEINKMFLSFLISTTSD
jgi:hypothetical protein